MNNEHRDKYKEPYIKMRNKKKTDGVLPNDILMFKGPFSSLIRVFNSSWDLILCENFLL